MNNIVYQWLSKYIEDDKKLVQYLYVLYILFSKYQDSIYSYKQEVKKIDVKLYDILDFFQEKKFSKKDIYKLLDYSIKQTWYNIYNLSKSPSFDNISLNWDIIYKQVEDDTWVYIKSADNKIYKRFLLDDVKKTLWI